MPAVKTHTAALAELLLDTAAQVYARDGANGLTLRRVASAAGTSPSAVYTLFGDKDALLGALLREGFRRLEATLRACPATQDPAADLLALGLAYRRAALLTPQLYELMFGHPVRSVRADPANREAAEGAYAPMLAAVRRAIESDTLTVGMTDAEAVSEHLWAIAHGMTSLELAGWLDGTPPQLEERYLAALTATGLAYIRR